MAAPTVINFRPPHNTKEGAYEPPFVSPSLKFIAGSWLVTHSTLPMWKNNRNVKITYTPLQSPPGALDDVVHYQSIGADKHKKIHGIDKPDPTRHSSYNWKGHGWLKVASSHWEILAHGEHEGGWVLTFFSKTMFTPAGIDIYARKNGGLSEAMISTIKSHMKKVDDVDFQRMVDDIFEVKHDW